MEEKSTKPFWKATASIRISHSNLDPDKLSQALNVVPSIAFRPGESKVAHGSCKSAGYLCIDFEVEAPDRPDRLFHLVEDFILQRKSLVEDLIRNGYAINVYIAIFSNILAFGFDLPATPTIWKLGITTGIEYFSK